MNRFAALVVVLWLSVDSLSHAAAQGTSGKQPAKTAQLDLKAVRKLIADLESADFKARDKASQELANLEQIPDALREAARSANAEVSRRARAALDRISQRLEERAYQELVAKLHQIEIDQLVRRMITGKEPAGDASWKLIQTILQTVKQRAEELAGRKFPVPDIDVLSLPLADLTRERTALFDKRVLFPGRKPRWTSWQKCVMLCTGATPRTTELSNSILIVDGDFSGATGIDNSILIVRGNVGRVTVVRGSIVIATGHFIGATRCDSSFLHVNNQQIRFTGSNDSVLVKTTLKTTGLTSSRTLDTDKGPLQLLKFSKRKPDAELAWGKEVNGLAAAIAATDHTDKFLVRWKNVGNGLLEVPWNRFHTEYDEHADDLLEHVFLTGPDGKRAVARRYEAPPGGGPRIRTNSIVLGPGQTFDETINLWDYVERPAAAGQYQLSVELEPFEVRRREFEARFWTGILESNKLQIKLERAP